MRALIILVICLTTFSLFSQSEKHYSEKLSVVTMSWSGNSPVVYYDHNDAAKHTYDYYVNYGDQPEKTFFQDAYEIFIDPFVDMMDEGSGWCILGIVMIVALIGVVVFLIWFIGSLIFQLIDSLYLEQKTAIGTVTNKEFTKVYTTYMPMSVGSVTTIMPIFHSNNWQLLIELACGQDTISVTEKYYDSTPVGTHLRVNYVVGRFSNKVYIKSYY